MPRSDTVKADTPASRKAAKPRPATVSAEDILCDPRWAALARRDRTADGRFYYSVRSTGVYCRPGCGARLPRPDNVRFHDSPEDAERAGFRPCRRCHPRGAPAASGGDARVSAACRFIEQSQTPPDLAALAQQAGLSPYHFHRLFKSVTGLTPRGYADAVRAGRVRAGLAAGLPVTRAALDAGFDSSSRFYARARAMLGMTPSAYRAGAAGETIRHALAPCALGLVLLAATPAGICHVALGSDAARLTGELRERFPGAQLVADDTGLRQWLRAVVRMMERPGPAPNLPLDIRGTVFQQRVWQALCTVPAGATVSYAELAERAGHAGAARAVAGACAANTIALLIPCHRAVRTDGTPSGYRWGAQRKRALLKRESGD